MTNIANVSPLMQCVHCSLCIQCGCIYYLHNKWKCISGCKMRSHIPSYKYEKDIENYNKQLKYECSVFYGFYFFIPVLFSSFGMGFWPFLSLSQPPVTVILPMWRWESSRIHYEYIMFITAFFFFWIFGSLFLNFFIQFFFFKFFFSFFIFLLFF